MKKILKSKTLELMNEIKKTVNDIEKCISENNIREVTKYSTSKSILGKVYFLVNELLSNENNLMSIASTLRFSFETLIHTLLIIEEPAHILHLRYNQFIHFIEKHKKLLNRIEEEILLLKQIEDFEKEYSSECFANSKLQKLKELDQKIDEILKFHITMFVEDAKFNGYGFQQYLLKEKIYKQYNSALKKIESKKSEYEKIIVENKMFQDIFGINIQPSQVQKKLSDKRSWEEKSRKVNLEKEYQLMYDLTSSLIHSTSYSLLTNPEISLAESEFFYTLLNQYLKRINTNIRAYCLLDLYLNENLVIVNYEQDDIYKTDIDNNAFKTNGYCPQCFFIDKKKVSMLVNSSDYFECPRCKLQILNYAPSKIAAILPTRGKGKIFSTECSEIWIKNYTISKAKVVANSIEPELSFFYSIKELKSYLDSIK